MTFSQDLSNNRDDHDERILEEKVEKKEELEKIILSASTSFLYQER
jgi:hypothetical protein